MATAAGHFSKSGRAQQGWFSRRHTTRRPAKRRAAGVSVWKFHPVGPSVGSAQKESPVHSFFGALCIQYKAINPHLQCPSTLCAAHGPTNLTDSTIMCSDVTVLTSAPLLSDARLQQARSLALDGVRHIQRRTGGYTRRREAKVQRNIRSGGRAGGFTEQKSAWRL